MPKTQKYGRNGWILPNLVTLVAPINIHQSIPLVYTEQNILKYFQISFKIWNIRTKRDRSNKPTKAFSKRKTVFSKFSMKVQHLIDISFIARWGQQGLTTSDTLKGAVRSWILDQRTPSVWRSINFLMVSSLTDLYWPVSVPTYKLITHSCLVKSNLVKQETSRTMILPFTMRVL